MALYQPVPNPPTWEEFEARCRERIAKIRASGDQGHFAGIYVNDIEILLRVALEMSEDDLSERTAYQIAATRT